MHNQFTQVMKEIEKDLGTKELTILILKSLKDSFKEYKGETIESLMKQLKEIIHIFNNTEPKYAIIIYNVNNLYKAIKQIITDGKKHHPYKEYKKQIDTKIDKLIKDAKNLKNLILKNATKIDVNNKTILIHDHSQTVQDVLWKLKKNKQNFRVIVAEQDIDKTLKNIENLTKRNIPFQVVPAHMLSNIENDIDMCFFGALTLKDTYDFVVDTGTNGIISEFHIHKTPIYLFMTTNKFSLWKSSKKESIKKQTHSRKHPSKKIHFERLKFSHDRIPLSSIDTIITEEGIFNQEQIKKIYQQKLKAHSTLLEDLK